MTDLESRLTELELRYTEQQRLLQDLSEVTYAQQKAIDLLTAEVVVLRKKLEAEPGVVEANAVERPPHY